MPLVESMPPELGEHSVNLRLHEASPWGTGACAYTAGFGKGWLVAVNTSGRPTPARGATAIRSWNVERLAAPRPVESAEEPAESARRKREALAA